MCPYFAVGRYQAISLCGGATAGRQLLSTCVIMRGYNNKCEKRDDGPFVGHEFFLGKHGLFASTSIHRITSKVGDDKRDCIGGDAFLWVVVHGQGHHVVVHLT